MARGLAGGAGRAAAGLARLRATVVAGSGGGKVRVMKGRVMAAFDSGDALGCTQLNKAQCAVNTKAAINNRGLSGVDAFSTTISA
jgi:hypothetical protein